ncbi:MAG: hypothetical protein IJB52_10350 [Clostridia bacterium]|nr:hypothetical protein [Clostridia bacterium]
MKHSIMTAKAMEELYIRYDLDEKTWKMLYEMACHNLIDYETWAKFFNKCKGYTFKDDEQTAVIDDYENQNVIYIRNKDGVLVRA